MGDDRGISLIEVNPGALAVAFSYESGFEALWFTIQSRLDVKCPARFDGRSVFRTGDNGPGSIVDQ